MKRVPAEYRLGWLLVAPAVTAMLVVTAWPVLYAVWLSLFRYDLRFPGQRAFVGLDNYLSVLGSQVWWQSLGNTLIITVTSVAVELLLGFALALLMHRALFGRRTVRTAILIPYGIITVVAALAWKFAFDPTTGFVNALLGLEQAWLTERGSALFVIIFTEVWKTTPFMALLLMAGLTLVPDDLLRAARVDGRPRSKTPARSLTRSTRRTASSRRSWGISPDRSWASVFSYSSEKLPRDNSAFNELMLRLAPPLRAARCGIARSIFATSSPSTRSSTSASCTMPSRRCCCRRSTGMPTASPNSCCGSGMTVSGIPKAWTTSLPNPWVLS